MLNGATGSDAQIFNWLSPADAGQDLFALLVNQQLGVTDNVDEQDVADLELHLGRTLGRHVILITSKRAT
jgi:hypothetical protein